MPSSIEACNPTLYEPIGFPVPASRPFHHSNQSPEGYENIATWEWNTDGNTPALLVCRYEEGKQDLGTFAKDNMQRIKRTIALGEAGLRPALEPVGIETFTAPSTHDVGSTILAVSFPATELFCERANNLFVQPAKYCGSLLRFQPYYGSNPRRESFSAYEMVEAMTNNTVLTAAGPSLSAHDILDHNVAYLCLDPRVIESLRTRAFKLWGEAPQDYHHDKFATPAMREFAEVLDSTINTRVLVGMLDDPNQHKDRWGELLQNTNSSTINAAIEYTLKRITFIGRCVRALDPERAA